MLRILRFAVLTVALLAAGAMADGTSGAASAQNLNQLRAQGVVGERFDGYAVARQPAGNKAVDEVNAKRRSIYNDRAGKQGVPAAQVGQVYAKQIMQRAPKGTWFQAQNGSWSRK